MHHPDRAVGPHGIGGLRESHELASVVRTEDDHIRLRRQPPDDDARRTTPQVIVERLFRNADDRHEMPGFDVELVDQRLWRTNALRPPLTSLRAENENGVTAAEGYPERAIGAAHALNGRE